MDNLRKNERESFKIRSSSRTLCIKWGLIPTEDEPEVARLAEAMFRVRLEVWLTRRLAASVASEVLLAA